jgi:hypothetical protein
MTVETVNLLLNWLETGTLLVILFRLSSTFQLIANTQRELRRAIHHLADCRTGGTEFDGVLYRSGFALGSSSWHRRADPKRGAEKDLAPLSTCLNR